ncbi:MAG: PAS domain-containing protein, partial [Candidatus Aminicenantes bacterium]|nr:PAS domain-containing protein [Candidatus Aminicenantes bacterium]
MDKLKKLKRMRREADVMENKRAKEQTADLRALNVQLKKEIALRKKAEEIAGLAYTELKQVFDAAGPLCLIDTNFNITRYNQAFTRLFNINEEEAADLVNKKCFHTWEAKSCHTDNCPLKKLARGEEPVEYEFKKKRGLEEGVTCLVKPTPFRSPGGELIGIVSSLTDVTERDKAARQASLQQEQLLQADKMTSLGILVSGVAHEINNPNSFISMNAPILKRVWKGLLPVLEKHFRKGEELDTGGMTFPEIRQMIPEILTGMEEGARRIDKIVTNLKEFARKEPQDQEEEVDISRVVASALTLLNNLIRKSTDKFSVTYGPDIPTFKGNSQQIEQVVVNLLINACQALPDTGKGVSAATAYDTETKKVVLIVRDEGRGIPADLVKKIFDPFYTTKRDSGGTGLGLSISSNIIKAHNGAITVDTSAQKG